MTDQESEDVEEQLTRIWQTEVSCQMDYPSDPNERSYNFCALLVEGILGVQSEVELWVREDSVSLSSGLAYHLLKVEQSGSISLSSASGRDEDEIEFESRWLDYFRRGCWLCGYDIEASAHEKAEWMRSFTREELEAWDLKL